MINRPVNRIKKKAKFYRYNTNIYYRFFLLNKYKKKMKKIVSYSVIKKNFSRPKTLPFKKNIIWKG